jgi:hypothetical protein
MKQHKPWSALLLPLLLSAPALAAPPELPEISGQHATPEPIEDGVRLLRSGRPLSASVVFADLLREGSYPEESSRLHYYLARSLADLDLLHSAEHHYTRVIAAGPDDPYFSYALARLIDISQVTGDETTLRRIAVKLDVAAFPRGARGVLSHLRAVHLYGQGDLDGAKRLLAAVEASSPRYGQARYLEGVILNQEGHPRSAVRAFKEVAGLDTADEQLRDLSVLNIARILYAAGEYEQARTFYALVPRDSDYWPEALFEAAWSLYRVGDQPHTLGHLLTIESPYFSSSTFNPELKILEAITWFSTCDTAAVERSLEQFYATYTPIHEALRDTLGQYQTRESLAGAEQVWAETFGAGEEVQTVLPVALFSRLLRNHDLAGVANHLALIDAELATIASQKSAWRQVMEDDLVATLQEDRQRLTNRAGRLVLAELARQDALIADLFMQADVIRYESAHAQYVEARDFDPARALELQREGNTISYAVDPRAVFWPFNGEFWEDELGYYSVVSPSRCQ